MIKHLMGGALIALSITGSLAAVFILDRPTTNTASTQPVTVKQEPQVLFYDGFDDTTLNSERWTNCFPGNNCTHEDNKELQCYTAENVKEIDRMLTITAKPQNAACNGKNYGYTSGLIQTDGKFSFKYGYLEVRAKTPPGQGLWSTVWLLAADHNLC